MDAPGPVRSDAVRRYLPHAAPGSNPPAPPEIRATRSVPQDLWPVPGALWLVLRVAVVPPASFFTTALYLASPAALTTEKSLTAKQANDTARPRCAQPQPKPTLAKAQRTPKKPESEGLALCDLGVLARDPTLSVSVTDGSHPQKSSRENKILMNSSTNGRTDI